MGHLIAIVLSIGAVIGPIVLSLVTDECKAWLPWLTKKAIDRAVRKLPAHQRERYNEEWRSHLNEVPGNLIRLWHAIDLSRAAVQIARTSIEASPQVAERLTATKIQIVFGTPVPKGSLDEMVDREINAAREHTLKIGNGAYYNAQIGRLAEILKPMCENWAQRGVLEAKLMASLNEDHNGQATAVKQTIIRTLRSK
jgi:hypothetical protein